jgi:hypothetical protein
MITLQLVVCETTCRNCGHRWIDSNIEAIAPGGAPSFVFSETRHFDHLTVEEQSIRFATAWQKEAPICFRCIAPDLTPLPTNFTLVSTHEDWGTVQEKDKARYYPNTKRKRVAQATQLNDLDLNNLLDDLT